MIALFDFVKHVYVYILLPYSCACWALHNFSRHPHHSLYHGQKLKDQIVEALGFSSHNVNSTITQLCVCVRSVAKLCLTLCDPMDYSPPGSSAHGLFQARVLQWAAISSSRGSSQPRDWTHVSCISCTVRQILDHWATWEAHSTLTLQQKADKNTPEWVWPDSNKTFYPDTTMEISSNFHLAWNIILLIFKPFSNVKTAFSSRASQNQVSDCQWPLTEEPQMSHPDLCESRKLPNELVFDALPDMKILFCWNKVGGFSHLSANEHLLSLKPSGVGVPIGICKFSLICWVYAFFSVEIHNQFFPKAIKGEAKADCLGSTLK